MSKKYLFFLISVFLFGLLSGWALEMAGFLGYGLKNPAMEDFFARIWPFKFWDYLW